MPPARKDRLLGSVLLTLAVLVALAIITYNAADNNAARQVSLDTLLVPDPSVKNGLGVIGAVFARYLVQKSLGYCSLVLPALLDLWGFMRFDDDLGQGYVTARP